MPRSRSAASHDPSAVPSFTIRSLTDPQIDRLHQASLDILEHAGVRFHAEDAVEALRRAGASVSESNLVRIPAHLVEWALRVAPKNIIIYDRDGRRAASLGGRRCYYSVGSDCASIYDLQTGLRRKAQLHDVVCGARLVDALRNIDFVMSMFLPSDAPSLTYEAYQMEIMLSECRKPVIFVGLTPASTKFALDMAAAVAGGMQELARRPFVINYVNPASAFQFERGSGVEADLRRRAQHSVHLGVGRRARHELADHAGRCPGSGKRRPVGRVGAVASRAGGIALHSGRWRGWWDQYAHPDQLLWPAGWAPGLGPGAFLWAAPLRHGRLQRCQALRRAGCCRGRALALRQHHFWGQPDSRHRLS